MDHIEAPLYVEDVLEGPVLSYLQKAAILLVRASHLESSAACHWDFVELLPGNQEQTTLVTTRTEAAMTEQYELITARLNERHPDGHRAEYLVFPSDPAKIAALAVQARIDAQDMLRAKSDWISAYNLL